MTTPSRMKKPDFLWLPLHMPLSIFCYIMNYSDIGDAFQNISYNIVRVALVCCSLVDTLPLEVPPKWSLSIKNKPRRYLMVCVSFMHRVFLLCFRFSYFFKQWRSQGRGLGGSTPAPLKLQIPRGEYGSITCDKPKSIFFIWRPPKKKILAACLSHNKTQIGRIGWNYG
jgi:hypothetical protein